MVLYASDTLHGKLGYESVLKEAGELWTKMIADLDTVMVKRQALYCQTSVLEMEYPTNLTAPSQLFSKHHCTIEVSLALLKCSSLLMLI